jgi:hypothetical protein
MKFNKYNKLKIVADNKRLACLFCSKQETSHAQTGYLNDNESGREVNTTQSYENALIQDRTAAVGRAVLFITELFHCASHEKKAYRQTCTIYSVI